MKPRYEIHSLSMTDVVEPESMSENGERAARALFAATETLHPNKLDTQFGRDLPQDKMWDYARRYRAAFVDQVGHIAAKINAIYEQDLRARKVPALIAELKSSDASLMQDAWGTEIQIDPQRWAPHNKLYLSVRSAGTDRRFGTVDDLAVTIETYTGRVVEAQQRGILETKIEHDFGPLNGLAQVVGSVTDSSGAVIAGATVTLRQARKTDRRTAVTDASGAFTLVGLPASSYEIEISARGFEAASRQIALQPRDCATVAATLMIGSAVETVAVTGEDSAFMTEPAVVAAPPSAHFSGAEAAGLERRVILTEKSNTKELNGAYSTGLNPRGASAAAQAHVRSYFPEALYVNPEIITDKNGMADITIPIADSITTWHMAMLASTVNGAAGTGTSAIKVFQDFFVDLDLPVTLTQGDRISIPVAIYNYAGSRGDVVLALQPDDWFSLVDDSATKQVAVDRGQVGGSQFTLEAKRIGKFKLTLSARMNGAARREDIVVREIEVVPNGREQNVVFNGRLEASEKPVARQIVQFPTESIPDASKIFLRLYPGPLSQVIEGMDSILRMPGGCFEQTSSSTYPNVLALDYMKRTKKLTPEVHAKAEGYIANGYQRLLTFEVPDGGFSWFGNGPANKILTAYGLMEFNDMSKVHDVDPKLIARTRDWLIAQQQADGSWKPDTSFINEGATNRYNSDLLRITAYIAWALTDTGYEGPELERARAFIEAHLDGKPDAYTLAVLANFAVEYGKNQMLTNQTMHMLVDAREENDEQVWWDADETGVYSTGSSAAIETTGLAVQALLKWRQAPAMARKALAYIAAKKEASGAWGTTQATIMALRALLIASDQGPSGVSGTVEVLLNGKHVEKLALTPENNDLFHQFVLSGIHQQEDNDVEVRFEGTGSLAYQVVGNYFKPWDARPIEEPLSIDVSYDRTHLAQNDIVTARVTLRNNLTKTANMVMVDLGIPPGFDLLSEDLQAFQEKTAGAKAGSMEKFSLTVTQAILYFNALAAKSDVALEFRLRAKYPIRARTFQSKVYEYYDPDVNSIARPVELQVTNR
jgi:uncharacterized protein YfaS (alpha-2-macroglobulin family)